MLNYKITGNLVNPSHLVLALHGMGTNGQDLEPLAQALDLPQVLYILPDAPLPMGPKTFQWYDFQTGSREIPTSAQLLHQLIAKLRKQYNLPLILMGFSQGAVMTLEAGLTLQPPPLALIALSGYLARLPELTSVVPPIFVAHGTEDPVIPIQAGRRLQEQLTQAGLTLTYQEFPIGHGISREVLLALRQFVVPLLN